MRRRHAWWNPTAGLWAALCGALSFMATPTEGAGADPDPRRDAVVQAVERVMPSVVNIRTKTRVRNRGMFYDWWRENWTPFTQELPPEESAGSGVVIDETGYVITNVHVVDGADEIFVQVGDEMVQAEKIVGSRRTDVALLKLRGKTGQKFKAARFAADDDLLLGETVMAMGNPFGLGGSVSRGILSAKSRRASPEENGDKLDIADWLQTDAAINPGNSGGPLVNLRGEVIGVNVAVLKVGQGIGFAVPVKRVAESLAEIFTPETVRGVWFGVRVRASPGGLRVSEVEPGSPADRAGVKAGDVVTAVNEESMRGFLEFNRALIAAPDRKPVVLSLRRGEERRKISVTGVPEREFFNEELVRKRIGATVRLWDGRGAGVDLKGLLVTAVERGGAAFEGGVEANMVILDFDGRAAGDVAEAARLLFRKKKGESVRVTVAVPWRRGARAGFEKAEAQLRLR